MIDAKPSQVVIHIPTNARGKIQAIRKEYDLYTKRMITTGMVIYDDGFKCWTNIEELKAES
jgi:hypothetical protein